MKTWIRWKGILAFAATIIVMGVFFKFFAGTLIAKSIEFTGSHMVGAKVDVGGAALSLFPLGLTLTDVQVTDPDQPMTNLFEVGRTRMSLETGPLLLKKVIVDTMAVTDIRLGTARKTSGALSERPKKSAPKDAEQESGQGTPLTLPSLDLPDVKEVLAKEHLAVVEESKALKNDMEKARKDFEQRFMALPDRETFEGYEDRFKSLKKGKLDIGNFLGKANELKTLEKDVKTDLDKIKDLRKDLKYQVKDFEQRIKKLPSLAVDDATRLKTKYAPNPQGMGNASAIFFGPKSAAWVEKGLTLYQKLKPWLVKTDNTKAKDADEEAPGPERDKGAYVTFAEKEPRPDFLIRHADLSLIIDAGELQGTLDRATNQQYLVGEPMTLGFNGSQLKGMEAVKLVAVIDRVKKDQPKDTVMLSIKKMALKTTALAKGSRMETRMENARADMAMNLAMSGDNLNGDLKATLGSVHLSPVNADSNDRLTQALGKALESVTTVNITAQLSGTLDDYNLDLKSDLDRVLADAVKKIVQNLADDFSGELKTALDEKAGQQVAGLTGDLDGFSGLDQELEQRLDMGSKTLQGF